MARITYKLLDESDHSSIGTLKTELNLVSGDFIVFEKLSYRVTGRKLTVLKTKSTVTLYISKR